jgi:hypothetical protein
LYAPEALKASTTPEVASLTYKVPFEGSTATSLRFANAPPGRPGWVLSHSLDEVVADPAPVIWHK